MRLSAIFTLLSLMVTGNFMVSARPVLFDAINPFEGRELDVLEFHARDLLNGIEVDARELQSRRELLDKFLDRREDQLVRITIVAFFLHNESAFVLQRRRNIRDHMRIGTIWVP
ncbi:hypothetical protein BYT27DRAFT_7261544 [Phlegmacium glaucopus]|nr:hypothetical protein BYT27DRAFT_7261544 [Phlegmacium glaucopus]